MRSLKFTLLLLWIAAIALAVWQYVSLDIPLQEYPELIKRYIEMFGIWGPIIYIVLYTLRPLILFPGSVLTVTSGIIFGPWLGIVYTIIGANLSATTVFYMGRFFGKSFADSLRKKNNTKLIDRLEQEGFLTVLLMRLLYFPYDFVGIISGASHISWRAYTLATFIGILPGLITFVLFGGAAGSATGVNDGQVWVTLALSAVFFVASLVLSHVIKRRYSNFAKLAE